jgi:hypothetical protein
MFLPPVPVPVHLWRDYDAEAREKPGMDLGEELLQPNTASAQDLFDRGARRVEFLQMIDLADRGSAWSLKMIGDLTSLAVIVDWWLRLDDYQEHWRLLNHLCPPGRLTGARRADEILIDWREEHYVGKCVYRRGPGFIQVRDRRRGDLRRVTIDDPSYLTVVESLVRGIDPGPDAVSIVTDLIDRRLVVRVGDFPLWLPYRAQRWFESEIFV